MATEGPVADWPLTGSITSEKDGRIISITLENAQQVERAIRLFCNADRVDISEPLTYTHSDEILSQNDGDASPDPPQEPVACSGTIKATQKVSLEPGMKEASRDITLQDVMEKSDGLQALKELAEELGRRELSREHSLRKTIFKLGSRVDLALAEMKSGDESRSAKFETACKVLEDIQLVCCAHEDDLERTDKILGTMQTANRAQDERLGRLELSVGGIQIEVASYHSQVQAICSVVARDQAVQDDNLESLERTGVRQDQAIADLQDQVRHLQGRLDKMETTQEYFLLRKKHGRSVACKEHPSSLLDEQDDLMIFD